MAYNTFLPIVTNGLIFCLDPSNTKSYTGTGTSSYDIKNLQEGTLLNGVSFNYDSYFGFDGVDDVVNFGTGGVAAQLRGTIEFTINVWVKKNSQSADTLFSAYDGSSYIGWFLQWYSDDNIYCGVLNATFGYNYCPLVWADEWFNITCVYDGSQTFDVDKIYIYVNGQPMTMINGGVINGSVPDTAIDFLVGSAVNYTGYLDGFCSSITIYNRKLTSVEILQNYNALKNRFI